MRAVTLILLLALWACNDPVEGAADAQATAPEGALAARVEALGPARGAGEALYLGVWGAGADDVWFAGGVRGGSGVLGHFDGEALRRVSIPAGPALWWGWGTDPAHRWVVGEGGRVLRSGRDGWRAEETGLGPLAVLWGVWGSGPTDLWAVGGSVRPGGPKGLVLRSAGHGAWRRVQALALPTEGNLYKVWGRGPDDVHFVGEGGVAVHFDGAAYRRVETPTTERLFTVHGRGELVLAVGGDAAGLALRFDGTRWVDDGAPAGLPPLNGVFVAEDGWAVVSAARGVLLTRSPAGEWQRHRTPARTFGLQHDTLHAVWLGVDLWAVGGDLDRGVGQVLSDRAPPPRVDPRAAPALDAGLDDLGLDATVDAAPVDAQPEPDQAVDAGPRCGNGVVEVGEACDDGNEAPGDGCDASCQVEAWPAAGEPCPAFRCADQLECWGIADASYLEVCLSPCATVEDCAAVFGDEPVCCQRPGPQLIETYCVPTRYLRDGACSRE